MSNFSPKSAPHREPTPRPTHITGAPSDLSGGALRLSLPRTRETIEKPPGGKSTSARSCTQRPTASNLTARQPPHRPGPTGHSSRRSKVPAPETSSPMQILLDFLRRYNYIFLFVVLEIVSLTLLFRFNDYQGSVWLTAAGEGAAQLNRAYTETESFFNLRDINGALTDDNLRLQRENASLRDALAEALHDSTHTERRVLQELGGYRLLPARVVSNNVRSGGDGYLVLDRGSADGIRPEMGVVGGGGVVGIIYLVGPRHSLVLPVTNSKSSISCCVRGSHYFGYLLWDGGSTRKAHVDDVPRYAKVRAGNIIETSGYSSVFPPGIFVGRVHRVSNSSDGQSYRLDVVLGTDFGNVRDVNVVLTPYKAEIDSLRAKADSLK